MKKSLLRMASLFMVSLFVVSQTAFADEAQLMDMVKNMQKQMNELQTTVMSQKNEILSQKNEILALKTGGGSIKIADRKSVV